MNAVIVDGDVSYPLTSGKRLRTYNLMVRMAQRKHQIIYVCRGNAAGSDAQLAVRCLEAQGIETVVVDDPVLQKKGTRFYRRLATNLFSRVPYSVASHSSRSMQEKLHRLARQRRVDLWQFEWTPYADMLPWTPPYRKLINAHNVDSVLWERYYRTEPNPARRWYIKQQWKKFENYERAMFPRATRVVTCSADDAAIVRERFRMGRVDVVDNGIDKNYFQTPQPGNRSARLLFLGSLDWWPNLDAIAVLLKTIWPTVRTAIPSARLEIVGRHPPDWLVRQVAGLPGVDLHADVADVRPYLSNCGVLVVPLRSGGGSRLKILEALASGLPVVSTRIGAEGLRLRPGRDLTVVERVEEMGQELLRCLRAPDQARAMAEHGRRLVLEQYDWDVLANKLERAWEKCV